MRDLATSRAKDAQRSIDYLVTRADTTKAPRPPARVLVQAWCSLHRRGAAPKARSQRAGMLSDKYPPEMDGPNFPRTQVPMLWSGRLISFTLLKRHAAAFHLLAKGRSQGARGLRAGIFCCEFIT